MANVESSFTERIIRRASLRRYQEVNGLPNLSKEFQERRDKILRAISDDVVIDDSCDNSIGHDVSLCETVISSEINSSINNKSLNNARKRPDVVPKIDRKSRNYWGLNYVEGSDAKNVPMYSKFTENSVKPIKPLMRSSTRVEDESPKLVSKITRKIEKNDVIPGSSLTSVLNMTQTIESDATTDLSFSGVTESYVTPLLDKFYDSETDLSDSSFGVKNLTTRAIVEVCKDVYEAAMIRVPRNVEKKLLENYGMLTSEKSEGLFSNLDSRKRLHSITSSMVPGAMDWKTCRSEKSRILSSSIGIQYEDKKLLPDYLSDEMTDENESFSRHKIYSDLTSTDLMSHDDYQIVLSKERRKNIHNSGTMEYSSPDKNNDTLDTSSKTHRSLSQRIKEKFRPKIRMPKINPVGMMKHSSSEEIDRIQDLLHEVKGQQNLMNYYANALRVIDMKKDNPTNYDEVKYERSLLLATLRRRAALEEIKKITSEDGTKKSTLLREEGELTISGISIDLRSEKLVNQNEWLVVAFTQGIHVWLTRANVCLDNHTMLKFTESINIPKLDPSFKITVQAYSLRVKPIKPFEERPRLNTSESKSTSCLPYYDILSSPKKLFKKFNDSPVLEDKNNAWKNRLSAFVLSGFTELFVHDLSSISTLSLIQVPSNSRLQGTINLNIACRLHLTTSHEGFVNFYEETSGSGTWNRRWCILRGHTLMFWSYPGDQDIQEPLKMIELIRCVSNEITTVDRTICPKPRTLLIETKRCRRPGDRNSNVFECTQKSTFVRNLLSFDSAEELFEWSDKLNQILLALEEWQIIGQRTQPRVSDL